MIAACLGSLKKQSFPLEIVVVDNGSTDGSQELLKEGYPEVVLIELDENTGFTGGVNIGIEYAMQEKAEYVLLFNNDAEAHRDWAKYLIEAADEHREAGIITGKLMRSDKKHIDSTGDFYTVWGLPFPRGRNELDQGQYDRAEYVFGASGGASLYRISALREFGLFDQDYFAYFEDVDISFRAQLRGWRVWYEPRAKAYHHIGGTSSKLGDFARYHSTKNFLLVYARNMPLKLYLKYIPLYLLQFLRMLLSSTLRGKGHVFVSGAYGAFRLHKSNVSKRRMVQKTRSADVSYIDSIIVHSRPPKPSPMEEEVT